MGDTQRSPTRIDFYLLKKSFRQVRKKKSAGVDKITAKEYAKDLDENLYNLYQRLRRGQYVATPVRRIWIDKEDFERATAGTGHCIKYVKIAGS